MLRLLLVVTIATSAWIFDHFHQRDKKVLDAIEQSRSQKQTETQLFYFNPASHAGLKLQVPRPTFKKVFFESESKFLVLHHSQRAHHSLKAEPLFIHRPLWLTQHHLVFRYHFSDRSDELPELT